MAHVANPYKTLGVARSAGTAQLRRAYHEKAKLYHPDKGAVQEPAFVKTTTII